MPDHIDHRKKRIFLGSITAVVASFFLLLFSVSPTYAAPVIFGFGGEKIVKVADLPDLPEFTDNGQHFDAGFRFKQLTIFFIPIWNYDEHWCGYIPSDPDHYLDLDYDDLAQLASAASVAIPDDPALPFWDQYGGKLLFLAIALLYGGYRLMMTSRRTALGA